MKVRNLRGVIVHNAEHLKDMFSFPSCQNDLFMLWQGLNYTSVWPRQIEEASRSITKEDCLKLHTDSMKNLCRNEKGNKPNDKIHRPKHHAQGAPFMYQKGIPFAKVCRLQHQLIG